MDKKIKHLEMIQSIINQIANHSFLIRSWSVTMVTALFAVAIHESDPKYLVIAYFPIPVFWLLDGFFFSQERTFRALYNHVRMLHEDTIDFSMYKADFSGGRNSWSVSMFSKTLIIFYLALVALVTIALIVVR